MARLSDLDIARCTVCGKLFQADADRARCAACAAEGGDGNDTAQPTLPAALRDAPNFTWQEVYEVFRKAEAREDADIPPRCVRCRARPALNESEFCLHCHIALHHDLGDAAHELFTKMDILDEHSPPKSRPVEAVLAEKRGRAAMRRIDPVAVPRVKKYS